MSTASCLQCNKPSKSPDVWADGEVCLQGMLFFCCMECAEKWARENLSEAYHPGQPAWSAVECKEPTDKERAIALVRRLRDYSKKVNMFAPDWCLLCDKSWAYHHDTCPIPDACTFLGEPLS